MCAKILTSPFNYLMQCVEQIVSFLCISYAVTHRRLEILPVSKTVLSQTVLFIVIFQWLNSDRFPVCLDSAQFFSLDYNKSTLD